MSVYYNEIDPFCCEWIRQLIKRGLIPDGEIDSRSIEDVRPDDLKGFTQCHFFAGIGGWPYAVRLAGWPDEHPVWTGSCPCQPFSAAGKRAGFADERHLWPSFFWLISQCKPDTIIGEQVASKDALAWWDIVHTDLEGAGYACGICDTCAAGFGAPHIRQRLYWVAHSESYGRRGRSNGDTPRVRGEVQIERRGSTCGVAESMLPREHQQAGSSNGQESPLSAGRPAPLQCNAGITANCAFGGLAHPTGDRVEDRPEGAGKSGQADGQGLYGLDCSGQVPCGLDNTVQQGLERYSRHDGANAGENKTGPVAEAGEFSGVVQSDGSGRDGGIFPQTSGTDGQAGQSATDGGVGAAGAMPTNGFWRNPDWLWCRDKKWRPVKSGLGPLVDGLPEGMVRCRDRRAIRQRLKGYGNAIVVPQAVEFIRAIMGVLDE